MAPKLPTTLLRRPTLASSHSKSSTLTHTSTPSNPSPALHGSHQVRHATFVLRSRRPYTFTQLVQLSDGSAYTMRTTSPLPLFKSTRDTRNHALWQPSDASLRNVEVDEAGKLAAFRARFGRGWDVDTAAAPEGAAAAAEVPKEEGEKEMDYDSFADLISGYAFRGGDKKAAGGLSAKEQAKLEKKKK